MYSKNDTNELIYKTEALTYLENRLVATKGARGINCEVGINTQLYIK